jgi:hypothetical protein
MPRYGPVWLEIAAEEYAQLPEAVRALVEVRLEQLLWRIRTSDQSRPTTADSALCGTLCAVHSDT